MTEHQFWRWAAYVRTLHWQQKHRVRKWGDLHPLTVLGGTMSEILMDFYTNLQDGRIRI